MYNDDSLLNCKRLCEFGEDGCIDPYTENEISKILRIYPLDSTLILILGPISIISSLFVIYTFYKYKECRQQPGDIILAISISELILVMHWMSMVVYDLSAGMGPISDDGFCQTEAVFSIMAGTAEFSYNCLFCIYIVLKIRFALNGKRIPKKTFHIMAIVVIICVITYCEITRSTGLSLFGMCSFKQSNNFGFLGIAIVIMYLFLSGGTIYYFRTSIPDSEEFKTYRNQFLSYYYTYVIMQSIIWLALAVSNFIAGLNCTDFQQPGLNFFITIGNTCKLATPICLSFIRYKDPNIRQQIRPALERRFPCFFKTKKETEISFMESQHNSTSGVIINTDRVSDKNQNNFFDQLESKLRVSQIYTMIAGIIACQKRSEHKPSLSLKEISREECRQRFEFRIEQKYITEYESLKLPKNSSCSIQDGTKIIMYAPRLFKTFIEIDRKMVNLDVSFNIMENFETIRTQFGGGDGGRSGSFFYMSKDTKMMMKSMTPDEKDIIIEKLYEYSSHFAENEDSFISKIYGIFTFSKGDKTEHILIMRNIQNVPSTFKLRTYDLKGSTIDRQVLKSSIPEKEREQMAGKKTLKDTDFAELERNGRVNIESSLAQKVSHILEKDAIFFKNIYVMDYSLLIFKINWSKYGIENNCNERDVIKTKFCSDLNCIESVYEPGVYYHMAIIDYLQVWNAQKQTEKKLKQVKFKNPNVDVSAQPPNEYADRFIMNIAQKLFTGVRNNMSQQQEINIPSSNPNAQSSQF